MPSHPELPSNGTVEVIIAGLGAQAKYCIETFNYYDNVEATTVLDLEDNFHDETKYGLQLKQYEQARDDLLGTGNRRWIVCHSDNETKATTYGELDELGAVFLNAIHPEATIASSAEVGTSNILNANAVVQPHATVGNGCMIHAGSIIEHDCEIDSFVNLAPGATLAGHVTVEEEAYVYTNASVLPTRTIGRGAEVGAGAVVTEDVDSNDTVAGVPAESIHDD